MKNKTQKEIDKMARRLIYYAALQVRNSSQPNWAMMSDWYREDKIKVYNRVEEIAKALTDETTHV